MKGLIAPNRYFCSAAFSLSGEVILPSAWTVFTGDNFSSCYSVTKFTMLGDITAVGVISGSVFTGCYSCNEWDFTHCTTVPTLYNTNCFYGIKASAKIKVPATLESQWKTATNWSTYADRIIGESDYNA